MLDQPAWMQREPDGYQLKFIDTDELVVPDIFDSEEEALELLDRWVEFGMHRAVKLVPFFDEPDMYP